MKRECVPCLDGQLEWRLPDVEALREPIWAEEDFAFEPWGGQDEPCAA